MARQFRQTRPNVDDFYPDISPQNVKSTLLERIQQKRQSNPLDCLSVVDNVLSQQAFPDSLYSRRWVLIEILITIVTEHLSALRHAMELPIQPPDMTRSEAFAAIKQDVRTGNNRLIGWSWLYYGYVRVDLAITQQLFSLKTSLDHRTLRRYQNAALMEITDALIRKETLARQSRMTASQVKLKQELTEFEIQITLKPHTIIEMIRSDPSLLRAFVDLLESPTWTEKVVLKG